MKTIPWDTALYYSKERHRCVLPAGADKGRRGQAAGGIQVNGGSMEDRFVVTDRLTAREYMDMRAAAGFREISPEQAAEGLKNSYVWCVRDGDLPAAIGRVIWDHGYVMYVADVIVRPEYQGQGLGREIMERVMAFARDQLRPGWRIMVSLLAAEGKEGFYEKFGFAERPREHHGPGMHRWLEKEGERDG